jgi:hypothetical protein
MHSDVIIDHNSFKASARTRMRRSHISWTQFLFRNALLLAIVVSPLAAQSGASGIAFLKLGVSGRGAAMGDALSAAATGAEAAFYNPAALAGFPSIHGGHSQALLTHKIWIEDTRVQFLASRIMLGNEDAIGVSLTHATVSDIEVRTRPGPAEGTFSARYLCVSLSYARSLSQLFSVGVSGKFLQEKLFVDEASGFAGDIGMRVNVPVEGLTIGLAVANLGGMNNLRNAATSLPTVLRAGGAYVTELPDIRSQLTLAPELLYYFHPGETAQAFGLEFLFDQQIAFRAGYQFGSETKGVSAGIGIRYAGLGLDYGYAPLSLDLGNTHTITLSTLL